MPDSSRTSGPVRAASTVRTRTACSACVLNSTASGTTLSPPTRSSSNSRNALPRQPPTPNRRNPMSQTTEKTTVQAAIEVHAPAQRAFEVFTRDFGAFKPADHNLLQAPIAETVVETHIGGHIIDRGADGRECRWARVLAYEPPHRFVFSWDISPRWQIETDPDRTSEVEVTFTALDDE